MTSDPEVPTKSVSCTSGPYAHEVCCRGTISIGTESPTHAPANPIQMVRYSSREHLKAAMPSPIRHGCTKKQGSPYIG